jgi:hypothetical protein
VPVKPNWIKLSREQQDELDRSSLPCPGWSFLPGRDLPRVFPDSFRKKIPLALLIGQQTSTGGTYLVISANRVDSPARAIDIEPFGLIVHSTGPSPSGVFMHHGTWEGRTQYPPAAFWEDVSGSGIGEYFRAHPPENLREGTLDQLPKGHREAFDAVILEIRAHEDSEKA